MTAKSRSRRTLEEQEGFLEGKLQNTRSRRAMKDLAQLTAGQKYLRAIKALAAVVEAPGGDEELKEAASQAVVSLAKVLEKCYAIMPEHVLPSPEESSEPTLPFEEPAASLASV